MAIIFKVHVTNWREQNPKQKSHYKKTLIANRIIHDAKVNSLPSGHRWLFIGLLLICGDTANDTITITERQVNDLVTAREGAEKALSRLQSLQLLTFEKVETLELREEKRREEKRREEKEVPATSSESAKPIPRDSPKIESRPTWDSFIDAYANRYGVPPTRNATTNAQMAAFLKRVPVDEGPEIAAFYVRHNGARYVAAAHSVGLLLADAEKLRTECLSGRRITRHDIKNSDSQGSLQAKFESIDRMFEEEK